MSAESLGVVVIGYHSDDVWADFFSSLAQSTQAPLEIVVVENSSVAPRHLSALYGAPVTVIHQPDNPGYGTAANIGTQHLSPRCTRVVICNPDVVLAKDALSALSAALEDYDNVGLVGPKILNTDGSLYPSARAFPGIRIGVGHALLGDIWKSNPWTRAYLGRYEGNLNRIVDWLSGACVMVDREVFNSVEGFDPRYFMFLEDVDLCFRLKQQGWRSLYVPEATITHSGAHSTKSRMADMVRVHHESAQQFLFTLYAGPKYWLLRQLLRAGLALRSLFAPLKYEQKIIKN